MTTTQHKTVMRLDELSEKVRPTPMDDHSVGFTNFDYDEPDDQDYNVLTIPRSLWEDMGRPKTITISVVPGDRLNTAGAQMGIGGTEVKPS